MKIFRIVSLGLLASSTIFAQPDQAKKTELSLSGFYQNISTNNSSNTFGAFLVSPRVGYFVTEGLELEPELTFAVVSQSDPMYQINGNLCYNFNRSTQTIPFILVGYGIANTTPFLNVPFDKIDFSVGVLNLGIGIKSYVSSDVAVRVEYRFQKYSGQGEENYYGYSYTNTLSESVHTVQIGFCILL